MDLSKIKNLETDTNNGAEFTYGSSRFRVGLGKKSCGCGVTLKKLEGTEEDMIEILRYGIQNLITWFRKEGLL
jgi:hypothetical protein